MAHRKGEKQRYEISIIGIVQGVGFRPYIYKLAKESHLTGSVKNQGGEVIIEVQGAIEDIRYFFSQINLQKPPAARIKKMKRKLISTKEEEKDFVIAPSNKIESKSREISPDLGLCDACAMELKDPYNRRYQFPFINCTNCGPRFSIIKDLPYDRSATTMENFEMCDFCYEEYSTTENRRFHAQPVCCSVCGPSIWLLNNKGEKLPFQVDLIRKSLLEGKIIGIKGIGGFHIICNAYHKQTVELLRQRKHRLQKPLALMARNLEVVKKYCKVSLEEEKLLTSSIKPIVILEKKRISKQILEYQEKTLLEHISNLHTLGIMLPYTPLHMLLFEEGLELLVVTSGNTPKQPLCYENDEAFMKLRGMVDYLVMHNRDILRPIDDSIMRVENEKEYVIRRARGLVPQSIDLSFIKDEVTEKAVQEVKNILALGAEQKNTFCMTKGSKAILSQHLGDLNNYEAMQNFYNLEKQFKHLFRIKPEKVVGDLHPDYLSSYIQAEYPVSPENKFKIQHHYAHIAACMAENQISHKLIGIAFDGTGYGDDGHIWGGEFLICDLRGYERVAHFEYVPMPGGEKSIKEPWRMKNAYLYQYGLFKPETKEEKLLYMQLDKKINCPLTSSVGRLFDSISALLGLCEVCEYEAQAAILLEECCKEKQLDVEQSEEEYAYELIGKNPMQISCALLIKGLLEDVHKQMPKSDIAIKFHKTIAKIIVDLCIKIRVDTGLQGVALGGGVFQNMYLVKLTQKRLEENKFCVYRNYDIPTNDGGISLGQAAIIYQEEKDVSISSRKD